MKILLIFSLIIIILSCIYGLFLNFKKNNIVKICENDNVKINNFKFFYQDKLKIIGIFDPIGIWTKKIWQEKAKLIENQLKHYDPDKGYFVNLILAQKSSESKNNNFYR